MCTLGAHIPARAETGARHGSILVPTPYAPRVQRCAATLGAGTLLETGVFGYTFPVSAGIPFALTADDKSSDFDIAFYVSAPSSCESNPNYVKTPWTNHNSPIDNTSSEVGQVPDDAAYAMVTLFQGPPASAFTYEEGAGATVKP